MVRLPLHNRNGDVIAEALVDEDDASLASYSWCRHSEGYVYRMARDGDRRQPVLLHREVCGLTVGDGLQADHKNGDKLDNRRANLRAVTNAQNAQNRRPGGNLLYAGKPTSSRFRGVYWNASRGKWYAGIVVAGTSRYLGSYVTEDEAGRAAAEARRELMPWSTS